MDLMLGFDGLESSGPALLVRSLASFICNSATCSGVLPVFTVALGRGTPRQQVQTNVVKLHRCVRTLLLVMPRMQT